MVELVVKLLSHCVALSQCGLFSLLEVEHPLCKWKVAGLIPAIGIFARLHSYAIRWKSTSDTTTSTVMHPFSSDHGS
jgi:hypothetical protein